MRYGEASIPDRVKKGEGGEIMKIRCWGARGSIPVSGKEYDLHGGDTCCLEIRTADGEIIIVDAGTGIRRLGKKLAQETARTLHIILTHAHWDHICGFPFFAPIYRKESAIRFYGCPFARRSIRNILSHTMEPPYFPVKLDEISAGLDFTETCGETYRIGSVAVTPILLSHPNQGIGYRFTEEGKSFVFLTDNELGFRHPGGLPWNDYAAFARGADLLIHDAEYTPEEYSRRRGWGHSHYREAVELAMEAKVGTLGLFHHNQDRTDAELVAIVEECRAVTAAAGSGMECVAVTQESCWEIQP